MKAVVFEQFGKPPTIQSVPDPTPSAEGVVIKVEATGAVPERLAWLDGA